MVGHIYQEVKPSIGNSWRKFPEKYEGQESLSIKTGKTVTPAYSAMPKAYYIQKAVGIGI
jgi:hypothetical protein